MKYSVKTHSDHEPKRVAAAKAAVPSEHTGETPSPSKAAIQRILQLSPEVNEAPTERARAALEQRNGAIEKRRRVSLTS